MAKRRKKNSKKVYNNRLLYSLIALGVLIIAAVGVYATTGATGAIPNPGHPISELQSCGTQGQILEVGSDGNWSCVSLPSSGETDPQVGTVTNGKWCTGNGTAINCNSNAPSAGTVSGGLYGYCNYQATTHVCTPTSPATCTSVGFCSCSSGYTQVQLNSYAGSYWYDSVYSCVKN